MTFWTTWQKHIVCVQDRINQSIANQLLSQDAVTHVFANFSYVLESTELTLSAFHQPILFWVKVRVFPSTFIVVWDLYSVLIRPVWQKYLEICASILFRNKGWKGTMEPWKYFQMKADIDALHWYWCRWTDADTLMLLFCCLLL